MRRPRFKAPGHHPVAYYHCVSRVVNREFVLGTQEKECFLQLMRACEGLCGLRVAAYCVMSNHFHILVEVPRRPALEDLPDDAGLVARVRAFLGGRAADVLERELAHLRGMGLVDAAEALRDRWFVRMWDVSEFMKTLKQRFSRWYNRHHKRTGALWEERFRSVLVEGEYEALRAVAAYIDLNPVRAGICGDSGDYRWCGYGDALAGARTAGEAVAWLVGPDAGGGLGAGAPDTDTALWKWRCYLFGMPENGAAREEGQVPEEGAQVFRPGIPRSEALEILACGGRLPQAEYLRCRVRYFTDGAVLGGREFVDDAFRRMRWRFGAKRRDGARPLRGLENPPDKSKRLYNLRQLQRDVFG